MLVGGLPACEGQVCWPGAPAVLFLWVLDTCLGIKKPVDKNGEGRGRGLVNVGLCLMEVNT